MCHFGVQPCWTLYLAGGNAPTFRRTSIPTLAKPLLKLSVRFNRVALEAGRP